MRRTKRTTGQACKVRYRCTYKYGTLYKGVVSTQRWADNNFCDEDVIEALFCTMSSCQFAYRERLHYLHLVILIKKHKKTYSTNEGRTLVSLRKNIEKNTRHQAVRWESKYLIFKYILSICLTVRQLAVQQKRTFSPWMPGMASRKLLKLSFMWSLLFRSKALWCALLSNCRLKIHVNIGIIFFLCIGNSLWCLQDT